MTTFVADAGSTNVGKMNRSDDVEARALCIVPLELCGRVKSRQSTLTRAAKPCTKMVTLPFFTL